MTRLLRAALLTSFFCLLPLSFAVDVSDDEIDDSVYLDGYVGLGAGFNRHLTESESGSRYNFKVEFARLRKWISMDFRAGIGQDYSDFGAMLRFYKHWKFGPESATGMLFGVGGGGMYSQGITPPAGLDRQAFFDAIAAPFVRYIWDWGNGVGMGFDLEYQLVPLTGYPGDTETDTYEDNQDLRQRVVFGVSFLFEVE